MTTVGTGTGASPPRTEQLTTEPLVAEELAARCGAVVADGERFCALYVRRARGDAEVVAIFARHGHRRVLVAPVSDAVPTITDVIPAAAWDEREAHDLYGVDFAGHRPMRPLVAHPEDLASWVVPVTGGDVHQVVVGPIHAGVIESGHFRFHVVGERVLHLDAQLFYKHRGLEVAAEGLEPERAIDVIGRACAACWAANTIAFAQACEMAEGVRPHAEVARARTLVLELERLYNHLHDLGAICAGVGFASGSMRFAALKELAQRLNRALTGHRFLFGSVRLGESALVLGPDEAAQFRRELEQIRTQFQRAWREMLFNGSVQDRLGGIGVVSAEAARAIGTAGPALRATGVLRDLRSDSPGLDYEGFVPTVPEQPNGDVAARVEMRAVELEATFGILDRLLTEGPICAGSADPGGDRMKLGVSGVESPRGETWCAVELVDGRVARVHLRTGSYANWPSVAHAAAESIIADFPLINKSFELCYACVDR